jgi:hypothetical protein
VTANSTKYCVVACTGSRGASSDSIGTWSYAACALSVWGAPRERASAPGCEYAAPAAGGYLGRSIEEFFARARGAPTVEPLPRQLADDGRRSSTSRNPSEFAPRRWKVDRLAADEHQLLAQADIHDDAVVEHCGPTKSTDRATGEAVGFR